MRIFWKVGLTAVFGAAVGLLGGQMTIAGMAPDVAMAAPTTAEWTGSAYSSPASSTPANAEDNRYASIAQACADCSDYDLGYRFAASHHVRMTNECMDYSWSYQRGCLAYLRES